MKTEEDRIKSIVDELQSGPFRKYEVRIHIVPKKQTLDNGKKEDGEQNGAKRE